MYSLLDDICYVRDRFTAECVNGVKGYEATGGAVAHFSIVL